MVDGICAERWGMRNVQGEGKSSGLALISNSFTCIKVS